MHGAGFTGSGERYLNSLVGLEGTAEGRVRVLVSSSEFGQGTNTILAQVAAEALNADYARIDVAQPDTTIVPNSGPTVASRTAMIVGGLVERASTNMLETLRLAGFLPQNHAPEELHTAVAAYVAQLGELKAFQRYEAPANIFWDDQHYTRRSLPNLRLGRLRRRGRGGQPDLRPHRNALRRPAGSRQGAASGACSGAD